MKIPQKQARVLFFYPNNEGDAGVPNGVTLLSSCLKNAGHKTSLFDTTFIAADPIAHEVRQTHGGVEKSDVADKWGVWDPKSLTEVGNLLLSEVKSYKPDFIAVTLFETSYKYGMEVLNRIYKEVKVPIIAGGIIVTLDPDLVINNDCIDAICVGEGESAIVEFASKVANNESYDDIKNIWVKKKKGHIIKNPKGPLTDLNEIPVGDWSIIDPRHMIRPFAGDFYNTAWIEMSRGCAFNCTFCCTPSQRLEARNDNLGIYYRRRKGEHVIAEILELKENYGLEFIFFLDDDFLEAPKQWLDDFVAEYAERVRLPFWIQTRSELIDESNLNKLVSANIAGISVGVEHGNEEFRKRILSRHMTNESLLNTFNMIHSCNIRSTANQVIGFPFETLRLHYDSINLVKKLKPHSFTLNYFQPYRGTPLRTLSVEQGFLDKDYVVHDPYKPILNMKHFKKDKMKFYFENFGAHVTGDKSFNTLHFGQMDLDFKNIPNVTHKFKRPEADNPEADKLKYDLPLVSGV